MRSIKIRAPSYRTLSTTILSFQTRRHSRSWTATKQMEATSIQIRLNKTNTSCYSKSSKFSMNNKHKMSSSNNSSSQLAQIKSSSSMMKRLICVCYWRWLLAYGKSSIAILISGINSSFFLLVLLLFFYDKVRRIFS